MKPKTTAELLVWCKELQLSEKQQEEIITYIGQLEQTLNEKNELLDKIQNVIRRDQKEKGNFY